MYENKQNQGVDDCNTFYFHRKYLLPLYRSIGAMILDRVHPKISLSRTLLVICLVRLNLFIIH